MFRRWKKFLPVVLIVLFSLFLFRDYFVRGLVPFPANLLVSYYEPWKSYPVPEYPHGPPNKAMGFDNLRIFYPVKRVAIEALRYRQPPLWNPYNFSGNVLLGSYQSAIFHPFAWLFLILPQIDAWSVMTMLQPILAALSMYIFLRVLGLSLSAQIIGALTFAFSGFFMTWWQESYMYTYSGMMLPLALTAIELYLKKPKGLWLTLLAVSLAVSIFSGMPQITVYVYAFAAMWVLYRIWKEKQRWRHALWFAVAFGLSGLIAAVQLIPSIEAYRLSTRISTEVKYIFDAFLLPLPQLVTLIAPDYFGNPATYNYFGSGFYHDRLVWFGTVPLVLLFTQVFRRTTKNTHEEFFLSSFVITLSLMLAIPTTWFILYTLKLPLLSTMTPSRIMILVTFAMSAIAAYAVEEYWKGFSIRRLCWITFVAVVALAAAGITPLILRYYDDKNTTWIISIRNLVIPAISFMTTLSVLWITAKRPKLRSIGFVIFLLIMLGNIFLFTKKYMYVSERRFVFPPVAAFDALKKLSPYDRFWTYENGYVEKNFASYYRLFSPEGYDAYMIRRYGEFLAFANSRGTSLEPDRSNALIQSTDHLTDILANPFRQKTLELLGVKYILRKLTPDKNEQMLLPDPKALPRVWEDGTYAIQEYTDALPRVKLYTDIRVVPDGNALLTELFRQKTDIHTTLFLEEQPPNLALTQTTQGNAEIVSYTPNVVTIETQADGDTMLFLSDTYYPGWNAYIDGKKSQVYRADYTFRAVSVPQGNQRVEFRYEPLTWKMGIIGTMIGILVCGAVALRKKY